MGSSGQIASEKHVMSKSLICDLPHGVIYILYIYQGNKVPFSIEKRCKDPL